MARGPCALSRTPAPRAAAVAAAVAPPGSGCGGAGLWCALRGDWRDLVIEGPGPTVCSLCSHPPIPRDDLPNLSLCFWALSSLISVAKCTSQCKNQTRNCVRFTLCSLFLQNEACFRPRHLLLLSPTPPQAPYSLTGFQTIWGHTYRRRSWGLWH